MVFTSRIEVFGVKPDFRFSFIINQFHNDLFLKGTLVFPEDTFLYFRKNQTDFMIRWFSFLIYLRFVPISYKNKYAREKNMILRVWLDRGRQCGHFAPHTLSKSLFICFRFFTYVVFHIFSVFFDLTGTFQVQPLSGKRLVVCIQF